MKAWRLRVVPAVLGRMAYEWVSYGEGLVEYVGCHLFYPVPFFKGMLKAHGMERYVVDTFDTTCRHVLCLGRGWEDEYRGVCIPVIAEDAERTVPVQQHFRYYRTLKPLGEVSRGSFLDERAVYAILDMYQPFSHDAALRILVERCGVVYERVEGSFIAERIDPLLNLLVEQKESATCEAQFSCASNKPVIEKFFCQVRKGATANVAQVARRVGVRPRVNANGG